MLPNDDVRRAVLLGALDMFVAKLAADGTCLWLRTFGTTDRFSGSTVIPESLSLAGDGAILVAGTYVGELDFGDVDTFIESENLFVAKLDPEGDLSWVRDLGLAVEHETRHVSVLAGPEGTVTLCGSYSGSVSLGGEAFSSSSPSDVFFGRLDAAGAHIESRVYAATGGAACHAIATTPDGADVLTGGFSGTIQLGGTTLEITGTHGEWVDTPNSGAFVAEYPRL